MSWRADTHIQSEQADSKMTTQKGSKFFIVERSGGSVYAYSESPDHHRHAEEDRIESRLKRVDAKILDNDCDLFTALAENSYIVIMQR